MSGHETLIVWAGDNRAGHFEVDGTKTDVPDDATLEEARLRLIGRTIVAVEEWHQGFAFRLDNGQVLDISGIWCNDSTADTGISFWGGPRV